MDLLLINGKDNALLQVPEGSVATELQYIVQVVGILQYQCDITLPPERNTPNGR